MSSAAATSCACWSFICVQASDDGAPCKVDDRPSAARACTRPKGGIVVAVQEALGVPVKLVGLGEGPDDLVPFDPAQFVDGLLG